MMNLADELLATAVGRDLKHLDEERYLETFTQSPRRRLQARGGPWRPSNNRSKPGDRWRPRSYGEYDLRCPEILDRSEPTACVRHQTRSLFVEQTRIERKLAQASALQVPLDQLVHLSKHRLKNALTLPTDGLSEQALVIHNRAVHQLDDLEERHVVRLPGQPETSAGAAARGHQTKLGQPLKHLPQVRLGHLEEAGNLAGRPVLRRISLSKITQRVDS